MKLGKIYTEHLFLIWKIRDTYLGNRTIRQADIHLKCLGLFLYYGNRACVATFIVCSCKRQLDLCLLLLHILCLLDVC